MDDGTPITATRYRLIIAAFLILSGAVIQPALGTLTDASALAAWVPSPRCRSLQSSAARPATIRQIRPTFDETVEGHKPEISETQPGLFETDLQSSPLAHIP
jgi:hypothetical protein